MVPVIMLLLASEAPALQHAHPNSHPVKSVDSLIQVFFLYFNFLKNKKNYFYMSKIS